MIVTSTYKQLHGKDENGEDVYQHVTHDPTAGIISKVKEAVSEALERGSNDKETANYLIVEDAKPGNSPNYERGNKFRKPSTWNPPHGRDTLLDCYINAVKNAILNRLWSNITRLERHVLHTLKCSKNIVIFQAGKGAAIVVQNCKDYLDET